MIQVKKALVVDDSRLARIALSKLLQRRNVDVDMVATGTEALDYLRTARPDVVFMDYMMPDMDGFEATRRIRLLPGETDIPVVMYTAQEHEQDRERAEALGIAGFLTKPSGEESLEEILASLGQVSRDLRATPSGASQEASPSRAEKPVPVQPAAAEPAEPTPQIAWSEIQDAVREAAEAKAVEAVERLVQQRIDGLRGELEKTIGEALGGDRSSTDAAVEETARRIAEHSAKETIERFRMEMGPEASNRIKGELRRELRGHMAELLAADVFRHQFTEIVLETALPRLRDEITEETLPAIRDRILEDSRGLARNAAREAAARAARDATSEQIAVSLTEYRMQADDRMRELIQAQAGRSRRSLFIGAAVGLMLIVAGAAASVYLSTHGLPF